VTGRSADKKTELVRLDDARGASLRAKLCLVDGALAPVLKLDLPDRLRGQAREQVARRMLRDQIGFDETRDEMHPLPDTQTNHKAWDRVIVTDTGLANTWRAQAGSSCRGLLPDYLSLPYGAGIWTVRRVGVGEGERIVARTGPVDGFTTDAGLARRMMARALAEASTPPRAVFWQGDGEVPGEEIFAQEQIEILTSKQALAASGLSVLSQARDPAHLVDLRRDPKAVRARLARRVLPWRLPLLVALLGAVLWSGAQWRATRALEVAAQVYRADSIELVRAGLVPNGPILDLRAQVSRALAGARAAQGAQVRDVSALAVTARVAEVLFGAGARVNALAYNRSDGLSAFLQVDDFAAADDLVDQLVRAGLSVTIVASRSSGQGTGVQMDLRIGDGARQEGDP